MLCLALGLGVADVALAEGPNGQAAAAAEALYQEGKRLLVDGHAEFACSKLETSQSLDAAVGTLLLLGHCYEHIGKTAGAWATFRGAESLARAAGQRERSEIARERADALEQGLARLEISLPGDVDTRSWSVREDDRELSSGVLGVPLPVDPGTRRISVRAAGYESWSERVTVPPGMGLTRLRIPRLTPRSALSRPLATAPPAEPSELGGTAAVDTPGSPAMRTWSYAGLGLGAATLAVGATYAVLASSRYHDSLDACRTETLCSARGLALRRRSSIPAPACRMLAMETVSSCRTTHPATETRA